MIEHSLSDLFQSAVDAFPNTQARQHLVNTIEIVQPGFMPFFGYEDLVCER